MAKILDTTPSWMKKENASVFDSFPKKAARKAMELLGLDTPEGQIEQAVMPAPLVSIFKNKIAREAGTRLFQDKVSKIGHEEIRDALRNFGMDYPRVAAHMNPEEVQVGKHFSGAMLGPRGKVTKPLNVAFNTDEPLHKFRSQAKDTVYHEGTHAAQALGNKDFDRLYDDAISLVGYEQNPFEKQARKAGTRSVMGNAGKPAGNAMTELAEIANNHHIADRSRQYTDSISREQTSSANSASGIIEKRTGIPRAKVPDTTPTGAELRRFLDNDKYKKKAK